MYEALNYKLMQINILIKNGWVQVSDGTYQFNDELEAYNTKQKPSLTPKQKIHAQYMIKKLFITNDLIMFYQSAEVFMQAMIRQKSSK